MIKILLLVFIVFAVSRTLLRWRDRAISFGWLAFWLALWLSAAVIVLLPETSTMLAERVGVGRGADLIIYISLLGLFYFQFRSFVRFERMEREMTKIVRELALLNKQKEDKERIEH